MYILLCKEGVILKQYYNDTIDSPCKFIGSADERTLETLGVPKSTTITSLEDSERSPNLASAARPDIDVALLGGELSSK